MTTAPIVQMLEVHSPYISGDDLLDHIEAIVLKPGRDVA